MSGAPADRGGAPGPTSASVPVARLHVVTDDRILARADFPSVAEAVIAAGGPRVALHVRGPRTSGRVVHDRVHGLLDPASARGSALFVNDRADVALTVGRDHGRPAARRPGDGPGPARPAEPPGLLVHVHLGSRSLPVGIARRLIGPYRLLGRSVHEQGEAVRARDEGANFIFVGTVFPTASHPGRKGIGVEGFRGILQGVGALPALAIGGVGPDRAGELVRAGAHGVAAITGVWSTSDPGAAVLEYLEAMADAVRPNEEHP